jgi:ketosteroid isomerase-like protein
MKETDHFLIRPAARGRAQVEEPGVSSKVEEELIGVAHEWDRAMVENDAAAIARYMADDWTIIGPDGSVGDKATFLGLVKSGALTHDVMESEDFHVRVYGDTAVVSARGVSGGKYQGRPFREVERSSCVFVRQQGQWRCVLTHLSRLAQTEAR